MMDTYNTQTRVLSVDGKTPQPEVIAQAATVIQRGGLVAFPTETVYGLGADALNPDAIARIFAAKQRPADDPIIAHIARVQDLSRLAVNIPDSAYKLAQMFWYGPLTMILKRADHVPATLSSGLPTVAVRMPSHPVARALIMAAGTPIAAPSANTFTRPSSTEAAHVVEDLNGRVDLILDGGKTTIGIESTVIDMTRDVPTVLRPGGVLIEDLRRVLPEVAMLNRRFDEPNDHNEASPSPGMMSKHYSPRAQVLLYDGNAAAVLARMHAVATEMVADHKRVGILTTDEEAATFTDTGARIISMGSRADIHQIAHVLFGAMRALDAQQVDKIMVRVYTREGLGAAVWDRLLRAAEGQLEHV
jgi:L-threonylcarbamoyladenylate synthase